METLGKCRLVKYRDLIGAQILRLDTKKEAEATIEMLGRAGFTDMDISIEDRFGNATIVKPTYDPTKVIKIMVMNERMGADHVYVRGYQDDTTVTIRIYNAEDGADVRDRTNGYQSKAKAMGQETIGRRFTKITLNKLGDYKLQKGDVIEITGTTTDGGRTNPYAKQL